MEVVAGRFLMVVLGVFLAGCAQPEERVLPLSDGQGISITPNTNARLARYDGMKMRVRVFTKHNGPMQLRATAATQFERTVTGLRLVKRADALGKVYIGEGVELVGGSAHAEQYPPCEVGVPMEEQVQLPCTPPPCEDVNDVEPCEPPVEPGDPGDPGDPAPPYEFFTFLATDTTVLERVATIFTESTTLTPMVQDSIHADSVSAFLGDSLGYMTAVVLDHDGLPVATSIDDGGAISFADFNWSGENLESVSVGYVTEEGDTLFVEYTEELSEAQLRADALELSQARALGIFSSISPECLGGLLLAGDKILASAKHLGLLAFTVAKNVNPAMKGLKMLKSGLNVYQGMFKGGVAASEIRTAGNVVAVLKRELFNLSGIPELSQNITSLWSSGAAVTGALLTLYGCLG